MIHYHGGPLTPETVAHKVWRGRHSLVSFAHPAQIELAASISQSFCLDNGAFTFWKRDGEIDRPGYYAWAGEYLMHPACDFALIPDVIGGTEAENDALIAEWPYASRGVPVWHLNESIDRLVRLAEDGWPRIALGSAAEYDVKTPSKCVARLNDVLPYVSDAKGRPKVKLHGLRMLNPYITTRIPLASGDSTNVAQNVGIDSRWTGTYAPATKETRGLVIAERLESHETPGCLMLPAEEDAA